MGAHITPDAELAMLLYIYSTEQTGEGIVVRSPMMADRRRIGLLLTPVARKLIETLLDRLIDQG